MGQFSAALAVIGKALRDWWDEWFSMIIMSLLWTLAWLTVILGPPATFGLYYVTHRLAHNDNLGVGGMVAGARRYLFKSWLWALLNLLAVLVFVADLAFYGQIDAIWAVLLQGVFFALSLGWLAVQFYALPFLMEQEQQQLRLALRNGALTALASPVYTLVMLIITAVLLASSLILVIPLFVGAPALIAVLGNRAVLERIATFGIREQDGPGSDS